jgi:hypothetical protein
MCRRAPRSRTPCEPSGHRRSTGRTRFTPCASGATMSRHHPLRRTSSCAGTAKTSPSIRSSCAPSRRGVPVAPRKRTLRSHWQRRVTSPNRGPSRCCDFCRAVSTLLSSYAAGNIGQQTEARTYIGFKLAIAGRDDEALTHFRWVADRGAKNYLEFELATNELNRLKYAPKAPAVP